MSSDDYSCLLNVEKNVNISLPLSYAVSGNFTAGIKEALKDWKGRYKPLFNGIVVDYNELRLIECKSLLQSDMPTLFCHIKATFSIFQPSVGRILKGVVNRISNVHVGCVVHESINVSIRLSEEVDIRNLLLAVGDEVFFEVTNIGIYRRGIRLKGAITEQCAELHKAHVNTTLKKKHIVFNDEDSKDSSEFMNHICNDSLVNGVQDKKQNSDVRADNDNIFNNSLLKIEVDSPSEDVPVKESKVKKKHKKDKRNTRESLSSNKKKKKKEKDKSSKKKSDSVKKKERKDKSTRKNSGEKSKKSKKSDILSSKHLVNEHIVDLKRVKVEISE